MHVAPMLRPGLPERCNGMKKLVLSSVLFPILAAACANDGGSPVPDLGATAQAMQDGTPETGPRTAGQQATIALRQVGNSEGGWVCSGQLVTPSLVLTAAHCIWPLGEQGRVTYSGFVATTSGAITYSTPGASFKNVADAWGMAINQENDESASARDIALIEIADVDALSPATFEGFAQPQSQRPLAAVDLSVPLLVGAVQSSYGQTSSTTTGGPVSGVGVL